MAQSEILKTKPAFTFEQVCGMKLIIANTPEIVFLSFHFEIKNRQKSIFKICTNFTLHRLYVSKQRAFLKVTEIIPKSPQTC